MASVCFRKPTAGCWACVPLARAAAQSAATHRATRGNRCEFMVLPFPTLGVADCTVWCLLSEHATTRVPSRTQPVIIPAVVAITGRCSLVAATVKDGCYDNSFGSGPHP